MCDKQRLLSRDSFKSVVHLRQRDQNHGNGTEQQWARCGLALDSYSYGFILSSAFDASKSFATSHCTVHTHSWMCGSVASKGVVTPARLFSPVEPNPGAFSALVWFTWVGLNTDFWCDPNSWTEISASGVGHCWCETSPQPIAASVPSTVPFERNEPQLPSHRIFSERKKHFTEVLSSVM